ncbi:MAG TPA: hypothetical protein DCZ40_12655 [Lachnospiraceae bacterium]|nr:hypothetical protein [Lachnospiraceae bacterium]
MYNPQLETFIRVADAGSFNKAAEQSYITPTAVIKQINLLEADLDVKLFERTHRGLILTKAGISLYNDVKYVIQYCKDSVTRAKNAMQEGDNVHPLLKVIPVEWNHSIPYGLLYSHAPSETVKHFLSALRTALRQ